MPPTPATTWAVFAHSVWHLTDQLNLTTGLRYSSDEKDYTHYRHNPDGSNIVVLSPVTPFEPRLPHWVQPGTNGTWSLDSDELRRVAVQVVQVGLDRLHRDLDQHAPVERAVPDEAQPMWEDCRDY